MLFRSRHKDHLDLLQKRDAPTFCEVCPIDSPSGPQRENSGDFIDLKLYENDMRYLIDNYIKADDNRKLNTFDNFTLLDFVLMQEEKLKGKDKEAVAEAIENNIRKKILEGRGQVRGRGGAQRDLRKNPSIKASTVSTVGIISTGRPARA